MHKARRSDSIRYANRDAGSRLIKNQQGNLQQALRKRRLGLGKVRGTESASDLMTKHVDAKLLGEHERSMGCELVADRAELAPQIVEEVEDVVDFVDDSPSGLLTASVSEQSAAHKIHCAIESEVCLPPGSLVHRVTDKMLSGWRQRTGRRPQSPKGKQLCRPRILQRTSAMSTFVGGLGRGEVLVLVPSVPVDSAHLRTRIESICAHATLISLSFSFDAFRARLRARWMYNTIEQADTSSVKCVYVCMYT